VRHFDIEWLWQNRNRGSGNAIVNPSPRPFKCPLRVSPAVIFVSRPFKYWSKMIYSSLFLNYMRYKHEIFTKMILKDGFIILPYNMSALYLSNGRSWFRIWVYDNHWSVLRNITLPLIHFTSIEIPSSHILYCYCCFSNSSLNDVITSISGYSSTLVNSWVEIHVAMCSFFHLSS
jgi:hypothetical protein